MTKTQYVDSKNSMRIKEYIQARLQHYGYNNRSGKQNWEIVLGESTALNLLIKSIVVDGGKKRDSYNVLDCHTSSLIAIIRNEIERKKGMIRPTQELLLEYYKDGYNTAITEDIQYWENVLEEIEKNV